MVDFPVPQAHRDTIRRFARVHLHMAPEIGDIARGDAAAVAVVHVNAWLSAYRGLMSDEFLDTITVEKWEARWRTTLGREQLPPVRVAVREKAIVGFCVVATPSRDEDTGDGVAEVVALNVSPDAWQPGVGSALLDDSLSRPAGGGWALASLWVLEGNARARALYTRFGFELDGSAVTHEDHGGHELRMRLALNRDTP